MAILEQARGRAGGLGNRASADPLLRNSLLSMTTTMTNAALGCAFWIVAAHVFEASAVGRATAGISAMNLAALVASLGLGPAIISRVPRLDDAEASRFLTSVAVVSGLVAVIAGSVLIEALGRLSPGLGRLTSGWAGPLLVVGVVAQVWGVLFDQLSLAELRAEAMLAHNTGFGFLKLLLAAGAGVAIGTGDRLLLAAWVLASVASMAIGAATLARVGGRRLRPDATGLVTAVVPTLRRSLSHNVAVLGGELPMFILPVIVVARGTDASGAYFYTTWMIGALFFTISSSASSVLFAKGSRDGVILPEERRRSILFIAALLVPALAGTLIIGPSLLGIFGADYARFGYPLLVLLVASAVPDAVTNVATAEWRVRGWTRAAGLLAIGMAITSLLVAWLTVPALGIAGAGAGWLVAQGAGAAVVFVVEAGRRRRGHLPAIASPTGSQQVTTQGEVLAACAS